MQTRTKDDALNPFPWYRLMRETQPVYYNPQYHFWQVFGYEDVQRVLSDYTSFSSVFGGGAESPRTISSVLYWTLKSTGSISINASSSAFASYCWSQAMKQRPT